MHKYKILATDLCHQPDRTPLELKGAIVPALFQQSS